MDLGGSNRLTNNPFQMSEGDTSRQTDNPFKMNLGSNRKSNMFFKDKSNQDDMFHMIMNNSRDFSSNNPLTPSHPKMDLKNESSHL